MKTTTITKKGFEMNTNIETYQWTTKENGTLVLSKDGYLRRANGGVIAQIPLELVKEVFLLVGAVDVDRLKRIVDSQPINEDKKTTPIQREIMRWNNADKEGRHAILREKGIIVAPQTAPLLLWNQAVAVLREDNYQITQSTRNYATALSQVGLGSPADETENAHQDCDCYHCCMYRSETEYERIFSY